MEEQKWEEKEKEKARTEPGLLDPRSQRRLVASGRQAGPSAAPLAASLSLDTRAGRGRCAARTLAKTSRSGAGPAGPRRAGRAGGGTAGAGPAREGRGRRRGRGGSDGAGQRERRPRHVAAGAAVPAAEQRRG